MSNNQNPNSDVNGQSETAKSRDSGSQYKDLPPGVEHISTIAQRELADIKARCERNGGFIK